MHHESIIYTLRNAISSAYRLALAYCGTDPHSIWNAGLTPEEDESYLLEIIEGARDAWRPIWRRRIVRPLEREPRNVP